MECPNCHYKHEPSYAVFGKEDKDVITGAHGDFFCLPKGAKRFNYDKYYTKQRTDVYGCPDCGSVFIKVEKE